MNLAAPTVLIVAALFPGFAFLHSYYQRPFQRDLTGLSPLTEIALVLFWALLIDFAACYVVLRDVVAQHPYLWTSPADKSSAAYWEAFLGGGQWGGAGLGYLSVIAASIILGSFLRRLVWALRLDTLFPMLRMKADWFYYLQGRGLCPRGSIPVADVLVRHPGKDQTRLYAGVVEAFSAGKDGEIHDLQLALAKRWRYDRVDEGRGWLPRNSGRWIEIPGDILVIRGDTIHSINMRYTPSEPETQIGWWRQARERARQVWRSLVFLEP